MAASTFENQDVTPARASISWGAIWVGVFTFGAIWSVFGVLGEAVFASAANSNAVRPGNTIGLGMSIWAVILTIIAMYVAGLETGRLAGVSSRHDGMIHGMAMFGLSMVAALVILVLGGNALAAGTTNLGVHSSYVLSVISGLGWAGFIALFLGWLAALLSASAGARRQAQAQGTVQPIRTAA
jgi:MFS family permease